MQSFTSLAVSAMALFGVATAQPYPIGNALVTVEASHGGAGSDLTNTTISVPIGAPYTDEALDAVSTLYLTGASSGLSADGVTCTPYKNADGTGAGGEPFDINTPSLLSTNTVVVGSIACQVGL
jgi:hypothetical protein